MDATTEKKRAKPWARRISWSPMLFGPVVVACLTVGHKLGADYDRLQVVLEQIGPYLIGVAAAIYVIRTAVTRNWPLAIVTFLVLSLMCREIHFAHMDKAIFALFGTAGAWAILWRKRITASPADWPHVSWLLAAMVTYALSQIIAKRVFSARHIPIIPGEDAIHTALEESAETAGHLILIVSAVVGSWRRRGAEGKK